MIPADSGGRVVLDNTASASDIPRLGRYQPRLRIGGGDALHVLVADHIGAAGPSRVVLRCLRSDGPANPVLRERFVDAARQAIRLCHPNLVQALDADLVAPTPYLVSEWIEGMSLAEFFAVVGRARLQLSELIWIVTEVLSALCYLHELRGLDGAVASVMHSEVTPSSILLTSGGSVKLLNSGFRGFSSSARLSSGPESGTAASDVAEVLAYAAPEQCLGLPVDPRADVYAVGALLWEVIAGRSRSTGESHMSRAEARVLNQEPSILEVWPTAPPKLAEICSRALEPNRDDRYESAREFKLELTQYLATTGDVVGKTPLREVLMSECRERFEQLEVKLAASANAARANASSGNSGPVSGRPPVSLLAIAAPPVSLYPFGTSVPAPPPKRTSVFSQRGVWGGVAALGLVFALALVARERTASRNVLLPAAASDAEAPPTPARAESVTAAATPAAAASLSTIDIDIATVPRGTLFIDGKMLGASPFKGSVPADGKEHVVLATAPGRVPEERVISYRSSVVLRFQLAKRRSKDTKRTPSE